MKAVHVQPGEYAIVSLGGCSASFVSPEGLVATNHHCVQGSIQYNSKEGQDYLTDGFLAKALADELPAAPGTRPAHRNAEAPGDRRLRTFFAQFAVQTVCTF